MTEEETNVIRKKKRATSGEKKSPKRAATTSLPSPEMGIRMPAAERAFLCARYQSATSILEYGSGGSTLFAASCSSEVYSVETDQAWRDKLAEDIDAQYPGHAITLVHADIGPTKGWGFPANHKQFRKYPLYSMTPWDDPRLNQPDLVLVDGRFRMACCIATLFRTRSPVTVLFDDYENRKHYRAVEEFMQPVEMIGRMARFELVPQSIPVEKMAQITKLLIDPR